FQARVPTRPPRTDTERELAALWGRVLRVEEVGGEDDFFALGGHSLLAARMFVEIRRIWGRDLPSTTLLHAPTVESLAAVIEDRAWAPSDRLVRMRRGEGRPLFVVHSLAGTVLQLWELLRALTTERPVFGIQARGLDAAQEAHASVEAMAQEYIELLRREQPHGPYALAGYSFGGLVAFEMARRLEQAGETVELLALVDTLVHERFLTGWQGLRSRLARPMRDLHAFRAVPAGERLAWLADKRDVLVDRLRTRLGGRARRLDLVGGFSDEAHLPPALRRVRGGMMVAMRAYRPGPYAGRVVFARAAVPGSIDPVPVWRRAARGGLALHTVPGDHEGLIKAPQVAALAALLDRHLGGDAAGAPQPS
ncbi:MAG: acetoacetate--CoA ligase, partial [Acetobacteraceae bacterium]|nr:acetoacetate--CoA ligase [Acetobacteraceae bacterium]